ncbi:MAG TPA: DNA-processing protein DprA [Chitinophagales bacterium]|nr:DNA-processing protein DprA [Chitinophagales bacterium]
MANQHAHRLLYQIALTMLPNIGSVLAKNLLAYCGSPEAVFKMPKQKLLKIPAIGEERAEAIVSADVLKAAEQELKFIDEYAIQTFFFTDDNYPTRLKACNDSPMLLYYKGGANLNAPKTIGIVGTRRATDYGKEFTKKLVADLAGHDVLIISGLAYGIDVAAHSAALDNNLNTVGVLAHGLNTIYPQQHKGIAKKMVQQGGLLTEYTSADEMSPHNFPQRNRIVAGLCDALIVVESGEKGGAIITANIANSYNREVFAAPGRATDKMSKGCNFLIKTYKATIAESAADMLDALGWQGEQSKNTGKKAQRQLAINLTAEEQGIYNLLNEKGEVEIDKLAEGANLSASSLAATLLEMEMNNLIVSLPGKRYKLV